MLSYNFDTLWGSIVVISRSLIQSNHISPYVSMSDSNSSPSCTVRYSSNIESSKVFSKWLSAVVASSDAWDFAFNGSSGGPRYPKFPATWWQTRLMNDLNSHFLPFKHFALRRCLSSLTEPSSSSSCRIARTTSLLSICKLRSNLTRFASLSRNSIFLPLSTRCTRRMVNPTMASRTGGKEDCCSQFRQWSQRKLHNIQCTSLHSILLLPCMPGCSQYDMRTRLNRIGEIPHEDQGWKLPQTGIRKRLESSTRQRRDVHIA